MGYKPRLEAKRILDQAWMWIHSVPYQVSSRWVFYRLLQDGTYSEKADYRHLLGLLSKARKGFYQGWTPETLVDGTREPVVRGSGFDSEDNWLRALRTTLTCSLDYWLSQPVYVEIWFEAAAMQPQFIHYANESVSLLAFHGDISIPEKWRAAKRLCSRWLRLRRPIHIYYYGDLDPKGEKIPESAWEDIELWAFWLMKAHDESVNGRNLKDLNFHRVGINKGQVNEFSIPENPERPGTYQWEALTDDQAARLIGKANELLDLDALALVKTQEEEITQRLRARI